MNSLNYLMSTLVLGVIFMLITIQGNAQESESEGTTDTKLIEAAREIMTAASTCALITLDKEGRPRVRVMDPFAPERDMTVWLATNPESRKVDQIQHDPRVTLYYLEQNSAGYVMIHGNARLVSDQNEKEQRWKDSWEAFYPNYPDGYLLIEVTPDWLEIVSYAHGIVGDSITWQPPVVSLNSGK